MPREAVEDLYEQWNDVAEGFGVDKDESREIFSVLQETLDMAKKPLASISDLLFDVYDTDNVCVALEERVEGGRGDGWGEGLETTG